MEFLFCPSFFNFSWLYIGRKNVSKTDFTSFFIVILSWEDTDKEADDYKIMCSMLWWGSNKCFAGASLLGIEGRERIPGGRDISVEPRKMTRVNQTVADAVGNQPGISTRTGTLIPLLAVVLPFDGSQLRSSPRNHLLLKEATLLKVISISRGAGVKGPPSCLSWDIPEGPSQFQSSSQDSLRLRSHFYWSSVFPSAQSYFFSTSQVLFPRVLSNKNPANK